MAATAKKSAAVRVNIKIRREKILKKRRAGMTIPAIARELKVSESTVEKDLQVIFDSLTTKTNNEAEKLRALWFDRCERMIVALWNKALVGDTDAIKTIVKIGEREARLFGLDKQQEKIDIVFITQIVKMIQLRGGDPMSIFKALYEELQDTPIMIEAMGHD